MHAAALAILVMLNLIAVWHIIALSLLFGIFSALDAPARQSMVVDLIDDRTYLGNAIALNSALFNSARLIGPAVAGIAIASVGEGICFLINAISYLAVISALLMLKVPQKPEPPKASPYQDEFLGGFRYTFKTAPIRQLIFMLAALSLAGYPFIVLLPAYAGEVLGGDSKTLGFLMSGLGAGALAGALIMAARKPASGLERIITIFTLCMGCAIIIASLSTSMTFSIVTLFFGGLSMILSLAAINTLLQTLAHEPMRGRVMSFYAMALLGTIPIGNLIAGSIASGVGIRYTMLAGGLTTIMAGLGFHLQNKNRAMHI
jgi:MFS family permease